MNMLEEMRKLKEKVWDNKPWDWGFVAVVNQLEANMDTLLKENAELKARLAEAEAKERSHALIAEQLENAIDCMATAEAENERLRSALEEYADMSNWLVNRDERTPTWIWLGDDGNAVAQAALRPEQPEPHTHYCQEHADRWECKDDNCERGEVSGCPEQSADATPTPAMLDAKKVVDNYE